MPFTSNPDEIEVSPEDTANALADDSAQVIDVREQDEWDEGRIEGTIHIPMDPARAAARRGRHRPPGDLPAAASAAAR